MTQNQPEYEMAKGKHLPSILTSRIDIVDIIRRVALLGILVINIPYFSLPTGYSQPFRNDPSTLNFGP